MQFVTIDGGEDHFEISSFSISGKHLMMNKQNGTLNDLAAALGEDQLRQIDLYITDREIDGIDTTGIEPAHSVTAVIEHRHIDANSEVYVDNINMRIFT